VYNWTNISRTNSLRLSTPFWHNYWIVVMRLLRELTTLIALNIEMSM
jgi:hypothetical protein